MASRTIRPTESPAPAPFAYTVSAPDGFAPEAVFASWDGTGAGGDFLPCVSYYNADGVLLDRAFPTTGAVTAGDTADVGYRPFERGGGTAAPPPPTPFQLFDVDHEGGWLKIVGNDGNPVGGLTVELAANAGGFGNGSMRLAAQNALQLDAAGNIVMTAADWSVSTNHAFIGTVAAGVIIGLPAGNSITVTDSNDNPIFRVNEDGSLQGKTGKTLTFNL